jgi:hypothetical protein
MQVKAINKLGAEMYLHITKITSPMLVNKYGEYSINFFNFPNSNQADDALVTKALIKLMITKPEWKFQVL